MWISCNIMNGRLGNAQPFLHSMIFRGFMKEENMGVEIERKWLVTEESLSKEQTIRKDELDYSDMEQGYLCRNPVVRIRKSKYKEGRTEYILCYKGQGLLEREEYNLPLTEEAYFMLRGKIEGRLIEKRRYRLPYGKHCIEWDIFKADLKGLMYAEVEFPSGEEALAFHPPAWFSRELTGEAGYSNADLAFQ